MTRRDPSLESLQNRIDAARARDEQGRPVDNDSSNPEGLGLAMRIGSELVAGVIVGGGVGWLLDRWLGTNPWFLIICFFMGIGAGFMNMKRTVELLDKQAQSATTPPAPANPWDDEDNED